VTLPFKIECDALTNEDLETIVHMIGSTFRFKEVRGVPVGGLCIADALKPYAGDPSGGFIHKCDVLIVDDVLTTGMSMLEIKRRYYPRRDNVLGVVLFARGECPPWVHPIFTLNRDYWTRK
jgi:hypothetical protein